MSDRIPSTIPKRPRGVVMCAGGVTYLTNAYIAIRLLRDRGCHLPVEIWYQDESEIDDRAKRLFDGMGVSFNSCMDVALLNGLKVPVGWALKPFSMLYSGFDEILYLDSDNFVVRDPSYLFETKEFNEFGAIFWPDFQKSSPYNKVWEMLGLFPKDEWEFESGQIVLRKSDFIEPLKFALQMNYESDRYYRHIWGDKDTFRFAWHKYNRKFAMPETPVELLTAAEGPKNGGVMCQHDFEGRRIFQHRNILKWQLFGNNPQIAGFYHEPLCRSVLDELRKRWDGRIHVAGEHSDSTTRKLKRVLTASSWLISGTGRVRAHRVTTTDNIYGMRDRELSFSWERVSSGDEIIGSERFAEIIRKGSEEIQFLESGILKGLESLGLWHWEVGARMAGVFLRLYGDRNTNAILTRRMGTVFNFWEGGLGERESYRPVRMAPLREIFPSNPAPRRKDQRSGAQFTERRLLITNSSAGIGDHAHSIYVAVGATKLFDEVVFQTPMHA